VIGECSAQGVEVNNEEHDRQNAKTETANGKASSNRVQHIQQKDEKPMAAPARDKRLIRQPMTAKRPGIQQSPTIHSIDGFVVDEAQDACHPVRHGNQPQQRQTVNWRNIAITLIDLERGEVQSFDLLRRPRKSLHSEPFQGRRKVGEHANL